MSCANDEKILQEIKEGNIENIKTMKDVTLIGTLNDDEVNQVISNFTINFIFYYAEKVHIFLEHANISERSMEIIIEKFPILLTVKSIRSKFTPKIKQRLLDDFCKNPEKYHKDQHKCGSIWITMEMDEDMWKQAISALRKPGAPDFRNTLKYELENGRISSELVAEYVIEGSCYYTGFPLTAKLTKKYFDLWLKRGDRFCFSEILELSEDRRLALMAYPEIYQYIKSPTAADAKTIIKVNPKNLSLVKKQTEKLCLMALKKDKSVFKYVKKPTKKILEFMGMDTKKASLYSKYPAKQYLITCRKDVADEDDIIYINVVPGKKMADFMSQKIERYGFGNMDCNDPLYAEDIMNAQAITDDELDVLRKFGILDLNTGFFCFDNDTDWD